jgi:hypothetical protein
MAPTLTRPFSVQFLTTGQVNRLELSIEFQQPLDETAREGITEVMTTFGKLAATGALAGRSHNPGLSSMMLAGSDFSAQGTSWVFEDVRIDPTSIFVLLNMIHYVHLEDVSVRVVRLAWPEAERLSDPMTIQFPAQWPDLSYVLDDEDPTEDVDVTIELRKPEPPEVTEAIVDAMSVWLLASHRGAYADDSFDPSKSAIFLGPDVMDVSPDRIVWFIEVMRCSGSALDGLLNLLERVHQRVAEISRVEIGP